MSVFGKLRNIFLGNPNSVNDNKKKPHHSFIKYDADPNEFWEIVGELGDGAFGKVYKAKNKVSQIFAALKQVDINDETELEDYSVEIDILNQCRHKNIVGLHEAYFFGGKLWMFIEFCGGGALDGIMVELEKPLTEPQIRYVCHEMCEALEFLHEHFVIHRDLKAGNVLLTCEGEVKLADFGVSAKNSSYRQKRDTFIGTPYWMAPEVILCETIKDSPYDFKADIWSFGITLIELAQIEPPNHEMHPMRVLIKIQKSDSPTLKYPSKWSKEFNDFVAKCLAKDPEQRPTAGDLLQHPFIRDVKDGQAIMELVSEANAEIILEEKDLDEDLMDEGIDLENRSATTTDIDSDTASTASSSNIQKANEDDNISDTSPVSGEVGKVPLPAIAINANGDKKTAEPEKSSPAEGAPPDADEPVILRKKKTPPDVDKTSSPEDESTSPPTGRKKNRTLTKTRKFVVNGEVVMSTVSKVIVPGSTTDKKQQEHQLWKADLRELKMLHKQEKKQLHDMDIRFLAAVEEQNRKFEQDNAIVVRNAENSLEQLTKTHKQQSDKMAVSHVSEMKNVQKKTKQEQDKDLRAFNEGLKQELKLLKQEVDLMPKESRKEVFQQRKKEKEVEHAEKERKFIELQKENMERTLKRVEEQQKDQKALSERQFLQLKQQTIRARETSLWENELSQLSDRHRLNMQQLDTKFMLKKQLMMVRHAKEMEQVQRINASKEEELLQCHLLENKRLPKIMKNEGKTRALMFKQSLRISVVGITAEQEKEKIKQFEETEKSRLKEEETRLRKKHKRQMEELKAKNDIVVKELEQVHTEKRNMLEDNERQKRKELEAEYEEKLKTVKEEQRPKKEALEAAFAREVADNEKFYSNGSSVDQDPGQGLVVGISQMALSRNIQLPTEDKQLSKISPQTARKIDTSGPPSEDTKRSSKLSPQSTKKIEVSVPPSDDIRCSSKLSPQSGKKIETSARSSEVAGSSNEKSTVCQTKPANTNSEVSSNTDSHRICQKVPAVATTNVDVIPPVKTGSVPEAVATTNVDVIPAVKTGSVPEAEKRVLTDIPEPKPQEEKVAISVPPLEVADEASHAKEEIAIVISASAEPPGPLEAEISAVALPNLVPDSTAQDGLKTSDAEVAVDSNKSDEIALPYSGGPVLVESRQKSDDIQTFTLETSPVGDAGVEYGIEKPVTELTTEVLALPLNEEITEVGSTEICDVPTKDAVGLALGDKSELLSLRSSEMLLPEQSSISIVPDLVSDGSDQQSSKTEFHLEKHEVCANAQNDLTPPNPQAEGAGSPVALENQSLATSAPSNDSMPHLDLMGHEQEKSEPSKHLQADVQVLNMGDCKMDQVEKSETSNDLIDVCLELSDLSPTVDHSCEETDAECKNDGDHAECKNDADPCDKHHFSYDADKVILMGADEAPIAISMNSNTTELVDNTEQEDQFPQTSQTTVHDDTERSNASCCSVETGISEKNVQSSGEVSESAEDKTSSTQEVTEPLDDEKTIEVKEKSSSLHEVAGLTQENIQTSPECVEFHHEKLNAEPAFDGSDCCVKSDVKDVDDSHSEEQNESTDDVVENPVVESSESHQQQGILAVKEVESETGHEHQEITSGGIDSQEKTDKFPDKEHESPNESPVANAETKESAVEDGTCAEAAESKSLESRAGEDRAKNKETDKDQ